MKGIKKFINIYTVVTLMTLLLSLFQLDMLSKGIASRFMNPEQSIASTTDAKDCPACIDADEIDAVKFTPVRIVIDQVNIDLPIVSVPLKNGTWEVHTDVANFAEGTDLVSKKGGNVGIFAHDRTKGFNNTRQLAQGYDIILFGNNYRATYKVEQKAIIEPNNVDVFFPTKESTLTLITCDGLFSEKRYMVKAKLVKIEKIK